MPEDTKDIAALFPADDIPLILEAVLDSCSALTKKHPSESEDKISDRLYCRLRMKKPFKDGPWLIDREVRLYEPESGKESSTGRLDFRILTQRSLGSEIYFVIEAKRLNVTFANGLDSLAGNYVKDGMMRFVSGKYAPQMLSSAMLGYVFDGNIKGARDNVARVIQRKAKCLKLAHAGKLQQSTALPHDSVHETRHQLTHRRFVLYHLFVAV